MTRALCLCLLLVGCTTIPEVEAAASKTVLVTPGLLTGDQLAAATVIPPLTGDPLAARTDALNARASALRTQP